MPEPVPPPPAMNPDYPPIGCGDWVASALSGPFQLGRVRDVYFDRHQGWLMDVAIYHPDGSRIGRVSPRAGGPSSFEPAIAFKDGWRRIERPKFPLGERNDGVPYQGEDGQMHTPLRFSYHQAVRSIPVRGRPVAVEAKAPVEPAPVQRSNFDPGLEAAARRMAAQTLRDIWRIMNPITERPGRDRIEIEFQRLEREAAEFQAEHDAATRAALERAQRRRTTRGRR